MSKVGAIECKGNFLFGRASLVSILPHTLRFGIMHNYCIVSFLLHLASTVHRAGKAIKSLPSENARPFLHTDPASHPDFLGATLGTGESGKGGMVNIFHFQTLHHCWNRGLDIAHCFALP